MRFFKVFALLAALITPTYSALAFPLPPAQVLPASAASIEPARTIANLTAFSGFQNGAPLQGRGVKFSSPVVAEIDGNSANGKEIAVSTPDGILNVMKSNGSLLWTARLPSAECSTSSPNNRAYGSPAVGELYGDGVKYIVAPYGGLGARKCDGGVAAYRGTDGTLVWRFSTKAWAKRERYGSAFFGVFSTPALADVDGDGLMEIGFGGFDRNVYLLNAGGSVRWYYHAADTVWPSPTFANVDAEPNLEMIIATDISRNDRMKPATKDGGFVYAFKTSRLARRSKRMGFNNKELLVWRTYLNQALYSSPVVADVLPSNAGDEVVIESGCYFKDRANNYRGNWIKVLAASTGRVLRTIKTMACSPSSPAIADIDNDGQLEIIATTSGAAQLGGDGRSRVSAWKADQAGPIWSVVPYANGRNDENGGHFQSPIVADLDGNGSLEVAVSNFGGIAILSAVDGRQLSCGSSSSRCAGLSGLTVGQSTNNSPAVSDLNGDGKLELIAAGGSKLAGEIFVWTNFDNALGSTPGNGAAHATPWPMWRKTATRAAQ